MTAELPGATAMALISGVPVSAGLIDAHCGPVVAVNAALTSLLRHNCVPPASMVLALFGSRMNGAMKLAPPVKPATPTPAHVSSMRYGAALHAVQLLLVGPQMSCENPAP